MNDEAGDRTRQDIAREFGIHPSTLTKWLGPKHPMRDRYKSYDRRKRYADQIREMHWEGHTYMYIAKTLGIPSSTVWDYINRPYKEG
jgi:transposase